MFLPLSPSRFPNPCTFLVFPFFPFLIPHLPLSCTLSFLYFSPLFPFLICFFHYSFFHFLLCVSPLLSSTSPCTPPLPLPSHFYPSYTSPCTPPPHPSFPPKPLPTFFPLLLYLIFYLSPSPSHAVKCSPARSSQPLACLGLTTANNESFTCRSSKQLGYSPKLTYTTCSED